MHACIVDTYQRSDRKCCIAHINHLRCIAHLSKERSERADDKWCIVMVSKNCNWLARITRDITQITWTHCKYVHTIQYNADEHIRNHGKNLSAVLLLVLGVFLFIHWRFSFSSSSLLLVLLLEYSATARSRLIFFHAFIYSWRIKAPASLSQSYSLWLAIVLVL